MKKQIVKLTLSLFAAAIVTAPVLSRAQDNGTNPPAAPGQTEPAKPKKHEGSVFRGSVSAVDAKAMTLTIGKRTFEVTSETKITKNGQPAILSDIAVGDKVGGAYKKTDDGKLAATTINDGKKPGDEPKP
ncbi:MAG: DUF5666 domain-containing protein [Verrucomicrobiota bacterium]|jgi:hypothetical protein